MNFLPSNKLMPGNWMKKENGQSLLLVLILLGVGAALIVPFLLVTDTVIKSRQLYGESIKEDYAADAAVEYGMWRLKHEPGFADSLPVGSESEPFYITLNGYTANTTITAQTLEFELSGQQLAGRAEDEIYFKVEKDLTVTAAYTSLAADGFEIIGYGCSDGNDGTGSWIGAWDFDGDAVISSSQSHEGDCCLWLEGDDNSYPGDGYAEREVNLSGSSGEGPFLSFWARVSSFESYDHDEAYVKVSTNGVSWDTLKTFNSGDNGDYVRYQYDLSSYGTPSSFYVAFETDLSSSYDDFYVDQIEFTNIEETETVEPGVDTVFTYYVSIQCLDPDGCNLDSVWDELPERGTSDEYLTYVEGSTDWDVIEYESFALDGFETSGDTGPWTGDWNLSGDAYETTDGEYEGDRCLRLDGRRYSGDGYAQRAINLSTFTGDGPYLYFWARTWLWYGDSLDIKVSTDGSNWDVLETLDVQDGDDQYHQYWYDLTDYGHPSLLYVAFEMDASSYWADNCRFRIDNVEFCNSQAPEEGEWPVPPFEPTGISVQGTGSERFQLLEWDFETAGYNDISFDYGEERLFSFQAHAALDEGTYCNRIYVTNSDGSWPYYNEDEASIVNGATAPIIVGDPEDTYCNDGKLEVNKTSDPEIVYPYEPAVVTYTITIENVDSSPIPIYEIEDWLPATGSTEASEGFTYVDDSATGRILGRESSPVLFNDSFNRWDSYTVSCWTESEGSYYDCQIDNERVELQINGGITQYNISTANYTDIVFSYDWTGRYACESTDRLYVDWKPSSSGTWNNLGNYNLHTEYWQNAEFDLPSTADDSSIDIRFYVDTDNGDEEARIDNVQITSDTQLSYTPVCMPDDNEGTDFFSETWEYQWPYFDYRWSIAWDFSHYPSEGDSVWDRCEAGGSDGACYLFPYHDYNPTLVLQPGEIFEIVFQAEGTLTYSGTYMNEVFVKIDEGGYWDQDDEWIYSWPTGTVIVPQYDLQAETLNSVLRANALLSPQGHWWRSWFWWWRR
jgi:hypothetical protein